MEYTFKRAEYADSTVLFDGCQEQPLDLDVSLPDYCPDIQRILKCQVVPCISAHSINGDHLETEGVARVRVLYLDSREDTVRCCEIESGFSSSIPLRETAVSAAARVGARVEYINCRATSPRRLDIHGAFSVCALVLDQRTQQICTHAEGDGLEQRRESCQVSSLSGLGEQQFTVSEMLEINNSKPPVENILRSRAYCVVKDCRPVSGKLLTKGNIHIEVLYSSGLDDTSLESMEFEIPFSQMIDCAGAGEDCCCNLRMEVTDLSLQVRNDSAGEAMRLEAEVRLSAFSCAYRDETVHYITDAYSTEFESELDFHQMQISCLDELIHESTVQKTALDMGSENISKILDIWSEISSIAGEIQNSQVVFSGKMNLCLLALDANGTPFYLEKMLDVSLNRPFAGEQDGRRVACWMQVGAVGYRITGNTGLEVSAEITVEGTISHTLLQKAVCGMHGDETRRKNENGAVLSLYYAGENESVWEIARSHGVSVRSICDENGLSSAEERLSEGQMLLLATP